MRRIIIVTATLLVSAIGTVGAQAQTASQLDSLPPGYKAVVVNALNLIQHGSTNPNPRNRGCLARQRQFADSVENLAGHSDMVERNPGMIGLRSRCMPVHVCINCPPGY